MKILDDILKKFYEKDEEESQSKSNSLFKRYSQKQDNDYIILKDNLFTMQKDIHIRKHTRFNNFPSHYHDYVECTYVINGSITQIINKKKIVLKTHDMIILNQNSSHEIMACNEQDIAVNFIINPAFLKRILIHSSENGSLSDFIIRNYIDNSSAKEYYIFRNLGENLQSIINLVINHYFTNDSQEKSNLLFTYVLTELFTQHLNIHENNIIPDSNFIKLYTRRYIDNEYYCGNLEDLSKKLNINYHYLSTYIRKVHGLSFKQLQQQKRLEIALRLVEKTKIPIKEIAHQVGYENLTYFYRIFKAKYGENPNYYRTKQLNTIESVIE